MALTSNPDYRMIAAGSAADARGPSLSVVVRLARGAAYVAIAVLMGYFLSVGTIESRSFYLLAFATGWLNPVWSIYALAMMGPTYLLDQSKTHLLAGIEVFILGMFAGELRLVGRPIRGANAEDQRDATMDVGGAAPPVYWGVWPHYLVGLLLMLAASSLVGLQLVVFRENAGEARFSQNNLINGLSQMFYFAATAPEWTLKSLWNWATGALVAVIVARRATPIIAARWMKIGGVALLAACFFGFLEWRGWLSLHHVRAPNPDPLHAGRFQGTAGHAGWFAQWIVLMWPGLLLWWAWGRGKRNVAVAGALAFVAMALVLTAARAGWLGAMVGGALGGVYLFVHYPALRRQLPKVLAIAIAIAAVGVFFGGDVLWHRVTNLLRAQDRANYYVSGLLFLREHPFGLGLGTHFQFYDWWINPSWTWAQFDHVDSHSIWLHTFIENGPFVPMMILAGLIGTVLEVRKSWALMDEHTRAILVALCLALAGIFTVGFAQYLPYIRIVELSIWIAFGLLVGICRKKRARQAEPVQSARGPRLLLLCGGGALLMASMNAPRAVTNSLPRAYSREKDGAVSVWTTGEWRTVVDRDIDHIAFSLYRKGYPDHKVKGLPAHGAVTWPDGRRETFTLQPEEWRYFEMRRESRTPERWAAPEFLSIAVTPLFTPAEFDPGSADRRQLGVYLNGLTFESERREKRDEPIWRY